MTNSRKGNILIGQSGGPTPVINASLAGIITAAQKDSSFSGIYGLVHGIEGALKSEFIDLNRESTETIELLKYTPSSILGSCRYKLTDEDFDRILRVFKAYDIRYFVYIGGNDSMDTCHRVSKLARFTGYELHVAGVPKTIDNDLILTDHTPGFGSAARFVALATRDAGLDLEAMATFDDVTILETMGRNAGWLAASSVLGKLSENDAPHLIYVPEIHFDENQFLENVSNIHSRLGRVFIVVCEGIRYEDGRFVGEHEINTNQKDEFGHKLVALSSGVSSYLSDLIRTKLNLQSRFLRPGLIGRDFSACISEIDREEAFEVGRKAVSYLHRGDDDFMVGLKRESEQPYSADTMRVQLDRVANQEKRLPNEFISPSGNMITDLFCRYALPLIGCPLPKIARLRGIQVTKNVRS